MKINGFIMLTLLKIITALSTVTTFYQMLLLLFVINNRYYFLVTLLTLITIISISFVSGYSHSKRIIAVTILFTMTTSIIISSITTPYTLPLTHILTSCLILTTAFLYYCNGSLLTVKFVK